MSKQSDILPAVIENLSREHPGSAIILHGSVQRGYERPDSDVDLFVITAGGDAMRLDLDRKVAGVTVQVCYWPSPLLAEEMRREPYLFYMLTYGHVLADPGGLAAEHQAAGRRYFDEHPRVTALWESQIEEVRHVRLAGCYEGGTFHKSPDTYPNHLWWAQFAEYLRERVRRMDDGRQ